MRLGIAFILMAAACTLAALLAESTFVTVLALNCSISFLVLGLAYLTHRPQLLMKRPGGTHGMATWILMWPYFALNRFTMALFRLTNRQPLFHEMVPGLYLGCRLWPWERRAVSALGVAGVLDLTSEFSEASFLRNGINYCCIPLLDTTAPTQAQLKAGVAFITENMQKGSVYVHCALGHSRSATFVGAYLIAAGIVPGVEAALEFIRNRRNRAGPNPAQVDALIEFAASNQSK